MQKSQVRELVNTLSDGLRELVASFENASFRQGWWQGEFPVVSLSLDQVPLPLHHGQPNELVMVTPFQFSEHVYDSEFVAKAAQRLFRLLRHFAWFPRSDTWTLVLSFRGHPMVSWDVPSHTQSLDVHVPSLLSLLRHVQRRNPKMQLVWDGVEWVGAAFASAEWLTWLATTNVYLMDVLWYPDAKVGWESELSKPESAFTLPHVCQP